MFDLKLRKKLTGKPTGNAHAYRINKPSRRTSANTEGEYRRKWMGYLNEYVQEDGSSKFYITDETWEDWIPWKGITLMGTNTLTSVQEFATLRAAQAVWDGVAEPIVQGVATEEMMKPLVIPSSCRWCKGNPMGLLMLEGYVPCTECGPKVVETVHDEVVVHGTDYTKAFEILKGHPSVQEGIVLKVEAGRRERVKGGVDLTKIKPMTFVESCLEELAENRQKQMEDRVVRPGAAEKYRKFLGEKTKTYRISIMPDAHFGETVYGVPKRVQELAAQMKAGTNPILNWLLNGDSQTGKEKVQGPVALKSRSSDESEHVKDDALELDIWKYNRAKELARKRGLSLDEDSLRDLLVQAEKNVEERRASRSSTKTEEATMSNFGKRPRTEWEQLNLDRFVEKENARRRRRDADGET